MNMSMSINKQRLNERSKSQQQIQRNTSKINSSKFEQSTTILQSNKKASINFSSRINHDIKNGKCCKYNECCSYSKSKQLKFKPEIHQIPFKLYPDSWAHHSKSRRDQWQVLIQDSRSKNIQRTEKKLKEEENKIKQLTFTPKISEFQTSSNQDKENVYEKLFHEAETRKINNLNRQKQELQRQQDQLEKYRCQQININKWNILNKEKFDLAPLYKRLQKVIQQKKRNRKMIAEKEITEFPFQPQINQMSKEIFSNKNQIKNVVDRLISEYNKKQIKISQLKEKYDHELQKQLTFKPTLNNYMPMTIQKIKEKEVQLMPTFIPSINPISSIMMHDRTYETFEQKLYRLHNAPIIKKNDNLNVIQAEAYFECHFNPQINQISRQLNITSHKTHNCPVKMEETPTHRPKINEVSHEMTEFKRAKSLDNTKKKNIEKANQYKNQMQYEEMRQCSFRPKIKDNKHERVQINTQMSLQRISGANKYLQTLEKAQEKQRKKKQLEDKLFNLQKNYDLRMAKSNKKANGK